MFRKLKIENSKFLLYGPRRNRPIIRWGAQSDDRADTSASTITVDLPGIEPGPKQCECLVIPFYYKPLENGLFNHFYRINNYVINWPVLKLSMITSLHFCNFINYVHTLNHFTKHRITIVCVISIVKGSIIY